MKKVDLTLIDLTKENTRELFCQATENISFKKILYETSLLFLSPIRSSNDSVYLSMIGQYPYQDQFWWSDSGDAKVFLDSLDFFLRKNLNFLKINRENLLLKAEKQSLLLFRDHFKRPNKNNFGMGLQKPPLSFLIGNSKKIQECRLNIQMACKKNSVTLLLGEAGLEQKEIGYYVHINSSRGESPFSHINLHQIPGRMHYQKLFGHIPDEIMDSGAPISITDQTSGTLFVEGLESLPWNVQSYLLKAIHDRDLLNKKKNKLKLIFSMSKEISFLLDSGLFRQDLISKLKMNTIRIPTLKQRESDLIYIIDQYLSWYQKRYKKPIRITPELKLVLAGYEWQKNITSLYDFLGKILTISNHEVCEVKTLNFLIKQNMLPTDFIREGNAPSTPSLFSESTLKGAFRPELVNVERLYIEQILKSENRNIAKTARILGISRKTLYSKLKNYQIKIG